MRTVISMGIGGFTFMGRNITLMLSRFNMEERKVLKFWIHKCDNESDAVGLSVLVVIWAATSVLIQLDPIHGQRFMQMLSS